MDEQVIHIYEKLPLFETMLIMGIVPAAAPLRPAYTRALMVSTPRAKAKGTPLQTIPGLPPTLKRPPCGCAFRERNLIGNSTLCLTDRVPESLPAAPRATMPRLPRLKG